MVDALLAELAEAGVTLVSDGDRLRYYPKAVIEPELVARLREHKAEVLEIVSTPWPDDYVEPPPCEKCGGMELWENPLGDWRCMKCDPPTRAIRLLEKTQRLRKRYGLPDPLGTA